jgi:hypothetical protein
MNHLSWCTLLAADFGRLGLVSAWSPRSICALAANRSVAEWSPVNGDFDLSPGRPPSPRLRNCVPHPLKPKYAASKTNTRFS